MRRLAALVICVFIAACATGKGKPAPNAPPGKEEKKHNPVSTTDPAPPVTLTQGKSTLGDTVLRLSEEIGGSLVLMNGIESIAIAPLKFKKEQFENFVTQLAAAGRCKVAAYPTYQFLYLEGYEAILETSVAGMLDPAYGHLTAAMTFSPGTPLFEVFVHISAGLGITIVADNVVAAARSGALTLTEIPLQDGLDAVLKSARVAKGTFQVASTPEYIFFYATQNTTPRSALLNPETLTAEQNALLDKPVDLVLPASPEDPKRILTLGGATSLQKVLGVLTRQFGIPVVAEQGLEDIPVNPCIFNHVRVRTVLDLLIRQWPVPEFGYQLANNQVVIQRRK
jgi:hypothetical protein